MTPELIEALAALAWPAMAAAALALLAPTLRTLVARRAFAIKIGAFELSAQEASDQLLKQIEDLQKKVASLEAAAARAPAPAASTVVAAGGAAASLRILWVDDKPRNNAAIVSALESEGHRVDLALSTAEADAKLGRLRPDVIITDMGRPEGRDAGLALMESLRGRGDRTPVALFTAWGAATWFADRLAKAGPLVVTDSPVELLAALRAVQPRQTP